MTSGLQRTDLVIVAARTTTGVKPSRGISLFVVEATHKGDLLGIPPTGRRVRWDAVDVYRIVNGKVVEEWASDDMAAILHQVGAYSPPWVK